MPLLGNASLRVTSYYNFGADRESSLFCLVDRLPGGVVNNGASSSTRRDFELCKKKKKRRSVLVAFLRGTNLA